MYTVRRQRLKASTSGCTAQKSPRAARSSAVSQGLAAVDVLEAALGHVLANLRRRVELVALASAFEEFVQRHVFVQAGEEHDPNELEELLLRQGRPA